MSTEYKNSPLSFKIALWISWAAFVVIGVAIAFLKLSDTPPESANAWLIIGVGMLALSGLIHAARFAHEAWTGLKNSWSRS